MEGVQFGEVNINNMRYADDTVLIAETEEMLQRLVDGLNEGCVRYRSEGQHRQKEVLGVTKRTGHLPVNISLVGCVLKQVRSFKYLGSLVCEDAKCDNDI